ncbi:MAG: envelope stress response membrane protein PspC [Azospirillum sp.]|nr:envelope stress response membrane protein PspC [Azospirillum sp.]
MYRPDSPFRSPNPHQLYRNRDRAKIFGVCAGIADFFGIEPIVIRLAAVGGLLFFAMPTLAGYFILALILPGRPKSLYRSAEEEEFWRSVSTKPDVTAAAVRHRFRDLDRRLATLESYVTTREFQLNSAIRDLDR